MQLHLSLYSNIIFQTLIAYLYSKIEFDFQIKSKIKNLIINKFDVIILLEIQNLLHLLRKIKSCYKFS